MLRNSKHLIVTFVLFGFILYPSFSWSADKIIKIAVVNLNKCVRESLKGKRLYRRLEDKRDVLQKKVNQKEAELKKLQDELKKQSMMLSPDALRKKRKLFERKQQEYRYFLEDAQDELREEEAKGIEKLLVDLRKVISNIAKKEGYTLVLEISKGGILYSKGNIDITSEVIKEFDNLK
jgi:outer membrane protein